MIDNQRSPSRLCETFGLSLLVSLMHGCQFGGGQRPAPTQIDRLIQVYPELKSGRMLVIGDFEEAKHMELVHLDARSEQASCVHDVKRGRRETGGGCVIFTAVSPDDAVVIDNANASQWYLKRDWRDYDLLMISLRAPTRGLSAEVAVSGGPAAKRLATQASIPLDLGWNVLRLDLAEIGERIPLDDVQEIRIGVSGVTKPTPIGIDDILLAGNREDWLGDSSGPSPGWYVQRIGRRWRVGARGEGNDFELAFANGQIVEWYNLTADPFRLHNLVRGTTLGPTPVLIDVPAGDSSDFSFLGNAVVAQPRIVEMNPVRVVIESEWRFVEDARAGLAGLDRRPFQRWRYVIYPSGQLYVTVEATAETPTWKGAKLGVAVSLTPSNPSAAEAHTGVAEMEAGSAESASFAWVRMADADAHLLFMANVNGRPVHISGTTDGAATGAGGRVELVASSEKPPGQVARWTCQLRIGAGPLTEAEAAAQARGYTHPSDLRVEVGAPRAIDGADLAADGYDAASGCYDLNADNGRVRFVVDGATRPVYSPAFRIAETRDHDVWVYVDHLIFDRTARDAEGNLIFQLSGKIGKPVRVEVILKRKAPTG